MYSRKTTSVVNMKRKLVRRRQYARSFVERDKLVDWGPYSQNTSLDREHGAVFDAPRLDHLMPRHDDQRPGRRAAGQWTWRCVFRPG